MKTDNELIAEFHGWKSHKIGKGTGQTYWSFPEWGRSHFTSNSLQYDKSWDWLMPVVEKIQNLDAEFSMTFGFYVMVNIGMRSRYVYCRIEDWRGKEVAGNAGGPTLIDCVYRTVVEFIKWYNENKSS